MRPSARQNSAQRTTGVLSAREKNHHIWLRQAAGQFPRHHLVVEDSSLVEQVFEGSTYYLNRAVRSADSTAESLPLEQ